MRMVFPSKLPASVRPKKPPTRFPECYTQDTVDFLGAPNEEFALHALGVGVLGGEESSFGAGHLAQDIIYRFLGDAAVQGRRVTR